MISFLKDENEKEEKTGLSDLILFLVIIALGVGGYFYFSHAEEETLVDYAAAEKLFVEKKYPEAFDAYSSLMDASWSTDSLDNVIYRNGQILDLIAYPPENVSPKDSIEKQWQVFETLSAQYIKDTTTFIINFKRPENISFLRHDQFITIKQWEAAQQKRLNQHSLYTLSDSLWSAGASQWTSKDTATFTIALDSINTGEYLTSLQNTQLSEWKNTLTPAMEE
ncbi:MAG: hypothetical protein OCC49_02400 [Fibrobacterales bacterium]